MPTLNFCKFAIKKKIDQIFETVTVKILGPLRARAGAHGAGVARLAGGRAPLFELALDELRGPDGQPRPLAELRRRLAREASTAWAAYVVGSLAVLMHEEGVSFEAGMSFIVRSDVPEGKGVSSSAAVS